MSSVTSTQSPTHASSASTATVSSPTGQASTASPPGPSTASSLSSPAFPPLPGVAGPAHHHAGPHAPAPPSRSSAGPSSQQQQHQPHSHLQSNLPSPSTQRQIEEARRAVVASIGNMLDNELQGRAAILHSNQAAIEKQFRDVEKATAALRKDNDKLGKVAADQARKVKEIGDVQNWAELLERDFLVLEETMRLVREGSSEDEDSWSGSGSWSGSASGSEVGEGDARAAGDVAERDGDGDLKMADGQQDAPAEAQKDTGKGKAREEVPADRMDIDPAQVPLPTDDQSSTEVGSSSSTALASHESETTLASVPVST